MDKKAFLQSFFDQLNSNHIDYFVYGEYKSLPESTGNSDLDMVINENHLSKFIEIFQNLLQEANVFNASFFSTTHSLMYRLMSGGEDFWGIQIDVFFKGFYHQNVSYFPLEKVRDSIIKYNGINVLDLKRAFYVDFLKELIHGVKIKEKYKQGFTGLIKSNPLKYQEELKNLYGAEFSHLVLSHIEDERYPLKELRDIMRKRVHRGKVLNKLSSLCSKCSRFFAKRPGYVIVVEGTDGSGKSTIINALTPWINECFHNGVVYHHLRPTVFPDLGVLLGKREKAQGVTVVSDPHASKPSGFVGSFVRWSYYMLDYTLGYAKSV